MNEHDDIAIKAENISKTFRLPHEKNTSIKGLVINLGRGRSYEKQQVLDDISFEVKKGEFFGIVGRNGSGKSTLLKLLAGIYRPSKGNIRVQGKLTPFIELGVGFNPELTGRENVYLNGALLGFSRKEMNSMYDDIVAFAELKKFMDQKLKNYSSGMQVRLAFSISIRANTDILLVDEVLAVGDAAFQQKCYEYFDRLKEEQRTIVLVTHDMSAIKQFCDRALLIDKGQIQHLGKPNEVSQSYERINYVEADEAEKQTKRKQEDVAIKTVDEKGKAKERFEHGSDVNFEITWQKHKKASAIGVVIYKGVEIVFAANTLGQDCDLSKGKVALKIPGILGDGRYKVSATLFGSNNRIVLANSKSQNLLLYNQPRKGSHDDEWQGITYLENAWS
jgi:ABC-2 type transport system ATP-binding protein